MRIIRYIVVIIGVILISTSGYTMTTRGFIAEQQDNLTALCEDGYGQTLPSLLYECMLTEFYGLNRVIRLLAKVDRESDDWTALVDLLEEYRWEDYNTYDFMAIHLEFEKYLEQLNKIE